MSNIQTLADAIAEDIEAADFSDVFEGSLTVERVFDPDKSLKDIPDVADGVLVTVIARSRTTVREARSYLKDTLVVDVAIRAKLPKDNADACDELDALRDAIADYWWGTAYEGLRFTSPEVPALWSVEHLADMQSWTASIALTFEGIRVAPERPVTP